MKNICIAVLSLVVLSCTTTVKSQNLDTAKLNQYFQALNDNNKFMGNVSIFKDGIEIYSKSVGFADIDKGIVNSGKSKCVIGSISKMITAVMVFQTIEAGKLSLSDTLDKYFPSIKNADKITIAHLLGHRSGIHNYTADGEFMKWTAKTRKQMIDIISTGDSDFEPDAAADYSNSNYVLLSYILETIYQKPYAEVLQTQIVRPLSLDNTYVGKNTVNLSDNESNSYLYSGKWELQTVTDPSVTMGAGCIVSTPKDLNKFADALFNGKLISAKSLSTMENIRDDIGLGLFPIPYFSEQGYGHRGGVDGFNSMLIYMPDDKISYAVTSNGLNYNFTEIHIAVLNCIYGQPLDIPNFNTAKISSRIPASYEGVYTCNQLPMEVVVSKEGNSLSVQATDQPKLHLSPISERVFRVPDNDVVLEFNPKKKALILIQGENVLYFKKR